MPIYDYECKLCGSKVQKIKELKDYNTIEFCHCGYELTKIPSRVSLGFVNKFKNIEREANAQGRIIKEPGLAEDAKRAKEYQEQNIKRNIRKHVEEVVSEIDI